MNKTEIFCDNNFSKEDKFKGFFIQIEINLANKNSE